MQEIIDATDFTEKRIKIYDKEYNKNLEDINTEIDIFVEFIINRKKQYISEKNLIHGIIIINIILRFISKEVI